MNHIHEVLQAAIEGMVDSIREDDDGVLMDWAIIAQTSSTDGESSSYYMAFSNEGMADHTALGLFDQASTMLRGQIVKRTNEQ